MKLLKIILPLLTITNFSISHAAVSETVKGPEVLTSKEIVFSTESKKGLVVVFLSAVCPCSNSHIQELASLSKDFPEFNFVGVHSNTDESMEKTKAYFQKMNLPFSVIQDNGAKIADQFKAYKTPHTFVMLPNGEIAYRGGVSSSKEFEDADHKFLREALGDIQNNRPVKTPEGRTLGCVIARGEKHVW